MKNLLFQKSSRRTSFLICLLLALIVYFFVIQHRLQYPYKWRMRFRSRPVVASEPEENALDFYNISIFYDADFKCIKTKTLPSTSVCLFSRFNDVYISHDLEETGMWEPQVTQSLLEVLKRDHGATFLDIGANIGYFTMLAAKMGNHVVVVEPVLENIHRIHRAVQIEKVWDHVVVVKNAVAETRLLATVRRSGDNQGDAKIEMHVKECQGSCPQTVRTILLNDLALITRDTKSVVIKIDVQGYEHRAFQNADVLFNQVNVTYIFMEWLLIRELFVDANHLSLEKFCVEDMLRFLFERNFRPYSVTLGSMGQPLDPAKWHLWPNDIAWHQQADVRIKSWLIWSHFHNWPPS